MRKPFRRPTLRGCGIVVVVLFLFEVATCQVFDLVVETDDVANVVRGGLATADGRILSYIRQPNAPPDAQRIVYVHGTPGDANAFRRYVADPIPGLDAYSFDRPGFGRTRPRKPLLTLHDQAAAIEPFLVEQGGRWPILVGHSLGGPIIAQAAVDYPDRVGGLVILCGSLDPAEERVAWYQHVVDFLPFSHMIPRFLRNCNRELLPMKAELEKLQPLLQTITCPVVIVHAPDDILVPFSNVDFMLRNFPAERIVDTVVLEGKNHFVPWNAEADVREAIRRVADAGTNAAVGEESP